MQTYFIGVLSGIISTIAIWIFIWTLRRGETDTSGTLENDIDRNNISTERGLGSLETNNIESGRIIDNSKGIANKGLKSLEDTDRTISEIIANAKRNGKTDD